MLHSFSLTLSYKYLKLINLLFILMLMSATYGVVEATYHREGGTQSTDSNSIQSGATHSRTGTGADQRDTYTNSDGSVATRSIDSSGSDSDSSSNNSTDGPPTALTFFFSSKAATGYFDSANSGTCAITGWAYDPDDAARSISVMVHRDGIYGVGNFVTYCQANQPRPDVNSGIGIPGNHGFNCTLPTSFRNTGTHALFVHAIDTTGGPNNLLKTNGKTINCSSAITPPPGGPITVTPTPPLTPGTISVTVESAVVRKLDTTTVNWQISNPIPTGYKCTLNGPGLVNISIFKQTGSQITQPIDNTSVFTVLCTNGTTPVSGKATVEIIPQVQEV